MPRSRNIKPSFFANECLADLSPHTRLLFIALWQLADCDGYLEDRPRRIAAFAFPFEASLPMDAMLNDLAHAGFIVRYESGGERFIHISNFRRHQNPHFKEKPLGIPKPEQASCLPQASLGLASGKPHSSPADSLLLIPDMVEHDACASEVIEEIGKHNSKPAQKRKPLSDEAKHLTRELQDALKRQGQSTFARDWFLTSASSAQALLNGGKSLEQIREVMRWALSEWACRQSITHFAHVAKAFPHFERQHATASSSLSDADPRIARIDRLMSCESIQNRLTGDILATAQLVRPLPFLLRHGGIELDVFEWEGVRHE